MNLLKECSGARRIGISGHVRPDGDCVGACLAAQMYLRKGVENADVRVFLESPPDIFSELSGFSEICSDFPEEEAFDVFVVLDCTPDRTGDAQKYLAQSARVINIDHHVSNKGAGDISLVEPQVGSVCEVLYSIMDPALLDTEIAKALYIGIIHDTGVFQYSNTRPETLQAAAHLISFGFPFPRMIEETFYQKSYIQSQIMGRALMESIRFLDGRCIVSALDRKTMDFYNATPKDLDGIVNQLRNIKGISCAIFMYETETLEYKVSMRSDENVDVAEVAAYFGGGGHMRAAGCTMSGTFYDCVNNLSLHIERQLMRNAK